MTESLSVLIDKYGNLRDRLAPEMEAMDELKRKIMDTMIEKKKTEMKGKVFEAKLKPNPDRVDYKIAREKVSSIIETEELNINDVIDKDHVYLKDKALLHKLGAAGEKLIEIFWKPANPTLNVKPIEKEKK